MKLNTLSAVLLLLAGATFGPEALAWGKTGHRVVGEVASRHLTPASARQVQTLLAGDSMAYVGNWADWIRSDPAWHRASPWHYINVREGQTLEAAARSPAGDVLRKIAEFEAVLADRGQSPQARAEALKWLIHLVGDLHQPLHVGRPDDRGGNTVRVRWFGEPRNLHQVWDSELIRHEEMSYTEWANRLESVYADRLAEWQRGTPEDWAKESMALLPALYQIGEGDLSWQYVYRHGATVEVRLQQAGVRLAMLLNRALAAK